jgi:TPR repeat protein
MFQRFQEYLLRRKIRHAIATATKELYSEHFDMDAVSRHIASPEEPDQLLLAYIAIRAATQLSTPITETDVRHALKQVKSVGTDSLESQRELAERCWRERTAKILKGKAAFQKDKYSFEAIVYQMEKAKKGPGTQREHEEWAKLTDAVRDAETELKTCLDEQLSRDAAHAQPDSQKPIPDQQAQNEIERLRRELVLLEDPATICTFGQLSFDGDGVEQDYVAAANWFRIAAQQGHARAQHNLALMYESGDGVLQDYSEAAKWYRMAADQGNAGSQNNFGRLLETGRGVAKDDLAAIQWYRRAAEGGDENAGSNFTRLTASVELKRYEDIVFAFGDLMAEHSPLIGDCAFLPHPKNTILYAIKFVVADYETKRELASNPALIESYDRMIPTLNHLFTCLARDWQEIAPDDKEAVARLIGLDSFPDWALPLKHKYIDEERALKEAVDAALQVLKDSVAREKANDW